MLKKSFGIAALVISLCTLVHANKHHLAKDMENKSNHLPYHMTETLLRTKFDTPKHTQLVKSARNTLFSGLKTNNVRVKYIAEKAAESYAAWVNLLNTFEQPDAFALLNTVPDQILTMIISGRRGTEIVTNGGEAIADPKFQNVQIGHKTTTAHESDIMLRSLMVGVLLMDNVMQGIYTFVNMNKGHINDPVNVVIKRLFDVLQQRDDREYIEHAVVTVATVMETLGQYYRFNSLQQFNKLVNQKQKIYFDSKPVHKPIIQGVIKLLKVPGFKSNIAYNLNIVSNALNKPDNLTNLLTDVYDNKHMYIPTNMPHLNVQDEKTKLSHARSIAQQVSNYLGINQPGPIDISKLSKKSNHADSRLQAVMEATLMAQRGLKIPAGHILLDGRLIIQGPKSYVNAMGQPKQSKTTKATEILVHRDINPYDMILRHEKISGNLDKSITRNSVDQAPHKKNSMAPNVAIVNADTLDVVSMLASDARSIFKNNPYIEQQIFNPIVLNLANKGDKPTSIGGGVLTKGSIAQEEEILRRMNMLPVYVKAWKTHLLGLTNNAHEIGEFDVLVTPNVYSYGGNMSTGYAPFPNHIVRSTVIAAAGKRLNHIKGPKGSGVAGSRQKIMSPWLISQIIQKKIRIFQAAIRHESSTMVLGALGLGAFIGGRDGKPLYVSEKRAYRRINAAIDRVLLEAFYRGFTTLKNVVFAIMVAKNKDADNYNAYQEIFADLLDSTNEKLTDEANGYIAVVRDLVMSELSKIYGFNHQKQSTGTIQGLFAYERKKPGAVNDYQQTAGYQGKHAVAPSASHKIQNIDDLIGYINSRIKGKYVMTQAQQNIMMRAFKEHQQTGENIRDIIQNNLDYRYQTGTQDDPKQKITGPILGCIKQYQDKKASKWQGQKTTHTKAKVSNLNQKPDTSGYFKNKVENIEVMIAYVARKLHMDKNGTMLSATQDKILRDAYQQHLSTKENFTKVVMSNAKWSYQSNGDNPKQKINGSILTYLGIFLSSDKNKKPNIGNANYGAMMAYIQQNKKFNSDLSEVQKRILKYAFYGSGGHTPHKINDWITANGFHKGSNLKTKITKNLSGLIIDYYNATVKGLDDDDEFISIQ